MLRRVNEILKTAFRSWTQLSLQCYWKHTYNQSLTLCKEAGRGAEDVGLFVRKKNTAVEDNSIIRYYEGKRLLSRGVLTSG